MAALRSALAPAVTFLRHPRTLSTTARVIDAVRKYPVASFDFSKVPISFPDIQRELRVSRFKIPPLDCSEAIYRAIMAEQTIRPFEERASLSRYEEESENPTTHSSRMYLGYHDATKLMTADMAQSPPHRYLLKVLPKTELGPIATSLAKREWLAPFIGWILEQPYFTKTCVIKSTNGEDFVIRRFLNAESGAKLVADASLYSERVLPSQLLIDMFAFQTIVVSSTEFANPGNVLLIVAPDGTLMSKIFKETPIVAIDNERCLPDAQMVEYIKNLVFVFRERRDDFSRDIPTNPFSKCWFDWRPSDSYPGSPGWRHKMAKEMGRDTFINIAMESIDPYLLVLQDRISRGLLPGPDKLFVSTSFTQKIIERQSLVRGAMRGFGLYPTELTSPLMPFNQGVDLVEARLMAGKGVSLSDCITGGLR